MPVKTVTPIMAMMIALLISLPGHGASARAELASEPPPGELADLHDLQSLQNVFERYDGEVRLVALLSPTCAYCIKGYRYMRRLLDDIEDPRLKMIVVWEPMLSGDSRPIAARQAERGTDSRMVYQGWDPEHLAGMAWAGVMGIESPAWDVYFLYGADATWGSDAPSRPAYWQHQGAGGRENWLDYDELKTRIERLLAQAG